MVDLEVVGQEVLKRGCCQYVPVEISKGLCRPERLCVAVERAYCFTQQGLVHRPCGRITWRVRRRVSCLAGLGNNVFGWAKVGGGDSLCCL